MPAKRIRHGKISSAHTTLIEAAVPLVRSVIDREDVRKVSPGFIVGNVGKLQRFRATVKSVVVVGGVKLTVRAQSSVQEIFMYCEHPSDIQESIRRAATAEGYCIK